MTPPAAVVSARHLPTPVHRCTAAEKSPVSSAYANASPRRSAGAGSRRSASSGRGRTMTPGFSRSSGSNTAFVAANARQRRGRIHQRQQLAARPTVAVLARHRAAVRRDELRRVQQERAEHAGAVGSIEREVDPDVHAAVAEVPVRHAGHAVGRPSAPRTRAGRRRACRPAPRRPPSRSRSACRPAAGTRDRRHPPGSATAPRSPPRR